MMAGRLEIRLTRADAMAQAELEAEQSHRSQADLFSRSGVKAPEPVPPSLADACRLVAWRAAQLLDDERGLHAPLLQIAEGPRWLFAIEYSHSDICNGGFHQYFWNPTGDLAHHAIAGLRAIGATARHDLFLRAMARFPGGKAPIDRAERIRLLDAIDYRADWRPWIDPLERQYFALEDSEPLAPLLESFALARSADFFLDE